MSSAQHRPYADVNRIPSWTFGLLNLWELSTNNRQRWALPHVRSLRAGRDEGPAATSAAAARWGSGASEPTREVSIGHMICPEPHTKPHKKPHKSGRPKPHMSWSEAVPAAAGKKSSAAPGNEVFRRRRRGL